MYLPMAAVVEGDLQPILPTTAVAAAGVLAQDLLETLSVHPQAAVGTEM